MSLFSFPAEVNERAARMVAAVVAATGVATLALQWRWPVAVLALGFLLRVGWGPKLSPLGRFASKVAPRLWEVVPVSGAPKRFAQGIGAVVTLAASALLAVGSPAGWVLVGLLVVFATLEAALSFCFGCWIYGRLQQHGLIAPDVCVDCAERSAARSRA